MSSTFLMDTNLGIRPDEQPWKDLFAKADITPVSTTDLERAESMYGDHEPDIAYLPSVTLHRLYARGDQHYRGILVSASKLTASPALNVLLIVAKDDPATDLNDLAGSRYAFINRSCSSTFFPPAILLARQGRRLEDFFELVPIEVGPTWQELAEAVASHQVRATMVLEDIWRTFPENAETTKVIGQFSPSVGPVVTVRDGFDRGISQRIVETALQYSPPWETVYGGFRPFYLVEMRAWFHELDELGHRS